MHFEQKNLYAVDFYILQFATCWMCSLSLSLSRQSKHVTMNSDAS